MSSDANGLGGHDENGFAPTAQLGKRLSLQLLSPVADKVACSESKVTVVGVGQVGMACAFSLLSQVKQVLQSLFLN